jgi:hypothetical protein
LPTAIRHALLRASIIAALCAAAIAPALAFDAAELMTLMAKVEQSSVRFEETKEVAALTSPLVRRGTLHYARPDRLEMRVAEPYFEHVLVSGDRVIIETKKGRREIDLSTVPVAGAWIAGLRATLSGDLAGLERYYRVELAGERADWKLALHPVERALSDVVEKIDISGNEANVTRIAIQERQGDRTVLLLSPMRGEKS